MLGFSLDSKQTRPVERADSSNPLLELQKGKF